VDDDAGGVDAAGPPEIACPWTGAFGFSVPERIDASDIGSGVGNPALSADYLTLYFAGGGNIWATLRPSRDEPFSEAIEAQGLSEMDVQERKFTPARDQLSGFLSVDLGDGTDVWEVGRPDGTSAWTRTRLATEISSPAHDFDVFLEPDELRLYLAPSTGLEQSLVVAVRGSRDVRFTPPVTIPVTVGLDNDPSVTADGRVLVFSSDRPEGPGSRNLWYSRRDDPDQPFEAVTLVPELNAAGGTSEPMVSADGCELFFGSDGVRPLLVARYEAR
jgi:hypothetical protein